MEELQNYKKIVLDSDNKNELYRVEIALTELAGRLHKSIKIADTPIEAVEYKADLSLTTSLIAICKERQIDVGRTADRLNYHFRMAAKLMLQPSTYQKIWQQAIMPRRETKQMKDDLKSNPLE